MSTTVWLITGAGRGMGTDIAKAALAAGHAVLATGRDPVRVAPAIGTHHDLLAVKLDVTNPTMPQPPLRRRSTGSAGLTFWSTMPQAPPLAATREPDLMTGLDIRESVTVLGDLGSDRRLSNNCCTIVL